MATKKINEEEEIKYPTWEKHHKHNDIVGALLLVFLGIIFLLNNLQIIPWEIWGYIWQFWPILLILLGLKIILGRGTMANFVTGVVMVVALIIIVLNGLKMVGSPLLVQLGLDKLPIYYWKLRY